MLVRLTDCGRVASPALQPAKTNDPRPVLIVLHQETSTPGRVGNALRALGHPLDIRRPRFGDPLPHSLDDHAGAVIFGGPMSANDPDDYIRREIDWIAVPLKERRPFLGICLGAQMLAKQLGARVAPHQHGRAEVGYYDIRPTAAGRAKCIIGTSKASSCRPARICWRKAATSRCRRSAAIRPTAFNSILTSPRR